MIKILVMFQGLTLPMFQLSLIVLLLNCVAFHVEAQTPFGPDDPTDEQTNFQPSVAVVIAILTIMFVLTIILIGYARFCHRRVSAVGNNHLGTAILSRSSRFSGIDKTVIEALPFFRFSSLKGSKEGLECSVCLSKFEDIEIMRLLPKCKHAFHINCIDHWLEKHSSCPLCRHKVTPEDLALLTYSNSLRFLSNGQSEHRQDSNTELFVQREEENHRGSSKFRIGSSFRKIEKAVDKELLIQEKGEAGVNHEEDQNIFHKHKHKIFVSDFEYKNRWSNLSSSDLMFLNSEMLNTVSSNRFSPRHLNNDEILTANTGHEEIVKIREEIEIKRLFENKVNKNTPIAPSTSESIETSGHGLNHGDKRSMSEITGLSRFVNLGFKNRLREPSLLESDVNNEERTRRVWLPIARRTVLWFANREKRPQQPLDV